MSMAVMGGPRGTLFGNMVTNHVIHHRGQVMLVQRMLGIVPHLTREREARMAQTRETKTS